MIKKGFSLVEIMLVVSIVFILASIAVVAGNSARQAARDNQRKADISLIQLKLESYRDQYGVYPKTLNVLKTATVVLPSDPSSAKSYKYVPLGFESDRLGTCGVSYYLYADLENNFPSTAQHVTKNGSLSSCAVGVDLPGDLSKIYDVTSPK